MSGSSKQRKKVKDFSIRFLEKFRAVMNDNIGPMIRDDKREGFNEVLKGLDDLLEEARRPHKQAPDLKGF